MSETVTQVSETEQKIVRSRTCGCRDFYIAKLTQNDAKAYVAETPVKLARAIKAKVDEKWSSATYAFASFCVSFASVRRRAQKRANCLRQQRASRVHSMREVLTMRMRFRSTNQTSFPETQRQQRQSRHGSAKCRRKTAV